MNNLNAVQIGLSGISRGLENLQDIATDIAQAGLESDDQGSSTNITESLVDLKQQEIATQASVKVVQAGQEVLGSLLDVTV